MSQDASTGAGSSSPAAGSVQNSQTTQAGGEGASGGGGGQQEEFHALERKFQGELESLRRETQGDREVLGRLKGAFSPESSQGPADPTDSKIAELLQKQEYYIQLSMTPKGQAMKHTMAIALQNIDTELNRLEGEKSSGSKFKELQAKVDRLTDPEYISNNNAYSQIDQMITRGIERLYGNGQETFQIRDSQKTAVVERMSQTLKEIQRANPRAWAEIKRDPQQMAKIVNDQLKSSVPPRALQIMEQKELEKWQPTEEDLVEMIREAKAKITNPDVRKKTIEKLRADLWSVKTQLHNSRQRQRR